MKKKRFAGLIGLLTAAVLTAGAAAGISGTVKVEGVSIPDVEEVNLTVGDKTTVKAVVTPLKATNKKVAWTIEGDKKAVSIDSADGDSVVIKGLSEGKGLVCYGGVQKSDRRNAAEGSA